MISTHVLSILVLVLAVAVVLICAALVYLQHRIDRAEAAVNARLDTLEVRVTPGKEC